MNFFRRRSIVERLLFCVVVVVMAPLGVVAAPVTPTADKHFDFSSGCRQAYQAIIQLRLEEGGRLLEVEKRRDPSNLIPYFLDNYIDFFQLFFNEDPVLYQSARDRLDQRIALMSEGPESSAFSLFTKSIIHFQWAAIRIKFGSNWEAGWEFRRSFIQSKECEKKFPDFGPAKMLSGAMQVVAGTIPDGYKWLSNLLGIRGSVAGGMERLENFLKMGDPGAAAWGGRAGDVWAELYRDEAIFYYLYLQFYIENKHEEVFQFIRQHRLDVKNNHLFTYLYANLCINDHRSALAEQIISQMNDGSGYMDMPVWDLEMGYARLNHLDPSAALYLGRFLQRFKGRFYVKDALEKLSWSYYLSGDMHKADSCRMLVISKGSAEADADRQALKDARAGKWPDRRLLRARLLSDGGYYSEALPSLEGMGSSDLALPEEKCELAYRLARIYDGLGRSDEAIGAYLTAIKTGEHLKEYYAARAALQTGYIYEQRGDKVRALAFFQKCLSLKDHEYKNSLDQRAKAGIARCKGDVGILCGVEWAKSLICRRLMLQSIHIQNYAIIDELSIQFSHRMNVITGETGAGKSILMGALSLILGDRADTAVLLQRDKKCVVEGTFVVKGKKEVLAFFTENELDVEEEVVIRREIAPTGKSRAFVNDTPVNLEQLRKLSSLLVDLHRQFDTLELGESDFQREVVDALAGQGAALEEYRNIYRTWQSAVRELATLQEQKAQFNKEFDYNKFLFDELNEAGWKENELEDLDQELKLLNNSEGIKNALSKVYNDLKEGELPMVQQLKSLQHLLHQYAAFHTELKGLADRISSVHIELQDIAGDVERINEDVGYDPRRIEEINERLSTGYKLLKKHGVHTTAELLDIFRRLEEKLKDSLQVDESIAAGEKEVGRLLQEVKKKAAVLSKARQAQVEPLEQQVNKLLKQVGMPNARLKVQVPTIELNAFGMDDIQFLFDANKSNRFEPIRKVASGGELSRLMLCIKSLVAESIDLATLIFDEIDTGISGEAAKQVGIILKGLARKRQVICITHQPQIAGKADAHYFVYKQVKGESIKTNIRLLNQEERITAIAQMLSGEKPTAAALENAREMVMQ